MDNSVCKILSLVIRISRISRTSRSFPNSMGQSLHLARKLARPTINRVIHRQHQLRVNGLVIALLPSIGCFHYLDRVIGLLSWQAIEALFRGFLCRRLLGPALQVEIGAAWHGQRRWCSCRPREQQRWLNCRMQKCTLIKNLLWCHTLLLLNRGQRGYIACYLGLLWVGVVLTSIVMTPRSWWLHLIKHCLRGHCYCCCWLIIILFYTKGLFQRWSMLQKL